MDSAMNDADHKKRQRFCCNGPAPLKLVSALPRRARQFAICVLMTISVGLLSRAAHSRAFLFPAFANSGSVPIPSPNPTAQYTDSGSSIDSNAVHDAAAEANSFRVVGRPSRGAAASVATSRRTSRDLPRGGTGSSENSKCLLETKRLNDCQARRFLADGDIQYASVGDPATADTTDGGDSDQPADKLDDNSSWMSLSIVELNKDSPSATLLPSSFFDVVPFAGSPLGLDFRNAEISSSRIAVKPPVLEKGLWRVQTRLRNAPSKSEWPFIQNYIPTFPLFVFRSGWYSFQGLKMTLLAGTAKVAPNTSVTVPLTHSWKTGDLFTDAPHIFAQVQSELDQTWAPIIASVKTTSFSLSVGWGGDQPSTLNSPLTVSWLAATDGTYLISDGFLVVTEIPRVSNASPDYQLPSGGKLRSQCGSLNSFASVNLDDDDPARTFRNPVLKSSSPSSLVYNIKSRKAPGDIHDGRLKVLIYAAASCVTIDGSDVALEPTDASTNAIAPAAGGDNDTIIYMTVGVVVGIVIVAVLLWFFCRPKPELAPTGIDQSPQQYADYPAPGVNFGGQPAAWGPPPRGRF